LTILKGAVLLIFSIDIGTGDALAASKTAASYALAWLQ